MVKTKFGLSNNQLKIIAMLTMLVDHVGVYLLPQFVTLRCIGRISFPIFAYMIAQGCQFTRNRIRYFMQIFWLGVMCQIVFFCVQGSLYQGVLMTFTLAIGLIFAIDYFVAKKNILSSLLLVAVCGAVAFLCYGLPELLPGTDYGIDYGLCGVLIPVAVRYLPGKAMKLLGVSVLLLGLVHTLGSLQWFAFLAIPLLAFYSGSRGRWNLKYLFYVFYPTHFVVLYLIKILLT